MPVPAAYRQGRYGVRVSVLLLLLHTLVGGLGFVMRFNQNAISLRRFRLPHKVE